MAIAEAGALPGLVALLKRYVPFRGPPNPGASVVRRAADAITNLAHENVAIKSKVRGEDGIPPLVALLEAFDPKVPLFLLPGKTCLAWLGNLYCGGCIAHFRSGIFEASWEKRDRLRAWSVGSNLQRWGCRQVEAMAYFAQSIFCPKLGGGGGLPNTKSQC